MKVAAARQAAFGALLAVERGGWSAEALAAKAAHLDTRDAGLASDVVFGTLRRLGQLDIEITRLAGRPAAKLDEAVRVALEMALYQIRFLNRVPAHAAVNDAVELVRRAGKSSAAAFANAVLRRAARESASVPDSEATPSWLAARWAAQFGEETALGIARAALEPPGRYIRVGGGSPPEGAEPTELSGCYSLPEGDSRGYRFQDISSQAVVPMLELSAGMTFLDVCAAPGNKTAQALESGARGIACDLHPSRARTLTNLGIPVVVLDGARPLPFRRGFDRILVDAPCSGTGTLGRNPEIKWRLRESDIADLQRRQTMILRSALTSLAPGGLLVYSTCSLEREENEDVVAASGAEVLRTMRRTPGVDAGDGFFAAQLRPHGKIGL